MPRLTLISRSYCHLCADMLAALKPLQLEFGFEVDVVDVDADPTLLAQYDELVPVLLAGPRPLCHYHLDVEAVVNHLKNTGLCAGTKTLESRP
jgi:thioredoxin reductase (NADPH)